jgi:hypothetical protein
MTDVGAHKALAGPIRIYMQTKKNHISPKMKKMLPWGGFLDNRVSPGGFCGHARSIRTKKVDSKNGHKGRIDSAPGVVLTPMVSVVGL